MTNELTDVRCHCGTEFPAESYDAGFIAGSGMCQNCDAALPPKDICTCPSGDGSLRHPCPAHPGVEQAGGDERDLQGTQGERDGWGPFPIVQVPWNVFDRAVMWVEDRRRYGDDGTIVDDWKALKTIQRAALAQPSTASDLDPLNLAPHAEAFNEAPDEALRPEQAEAERPTYECTMGVGGGDGNLFVHGDRASIKAAQHIVLERDAALAEVERLRQFERICEGLPQDAIDGGWTVQGIRCYAKRLEDQLKVALARVAELTATRNRYGVDAHYFNKNLQRILRDFENFTPDELARSLIILAKVADEKVVAQAQHSVPEGWMLVECGIWTQEQVDEMQKTVARFRNSEFVDDRALAMAVADAGQCKAPEISLAELLAAAPGKEG
ncbi:hypothetical protein [Pseudomonas aeruginosa]|uniref:hypothetical protein n=1 Tax=Pseudomonas aeruginosa TaxID=287 RepID=UPI0020C64DEB|nr:hypothetical protein [Pseudomonas aeruginosa]UTL98253.1 hypothetical protein NLS69_07450 [Pseudomonas aeruginosa]